MQVEKKVSSFQPIVDKHVGKNLWHIYLLVGTR
jgi:hypothetical protein